MILAAIGLITRNYDQGLGYMGSTIFTLLHVFGFEFFLRSGSVIFNIEAQQALY